MTKRALKTSPTLAQTQASCPHNLLMIENIDIKNTQGGIFNDEFYVCSSCFKIIAVAPSRPLDTELNKMTTAINNLGTLFKKLVDTLKARK